MDTDEELDEDDDLDIDEEEDDEESSESTEDSDDESESSDDSDEGEESRKKKQPNNFKALREEMKRLKKENEELRAGSGKAKKKEKPLSDIAELRLDLFIVNNPEAKEHRNAIIETIKRFPGCTYEEGLAWAKANAPKESKSKRDVSMVSRKKPKDLLSLTDEEALSLDSKSFLERDRLKNMRGNGMPFKK